METWKGESPQPPPMCSLHLDDAMAAILRQNAHHTTAYWWRGDSDEANQYGDDYEAMMNRGQGANF